MLRRKQILLDGETERDLQYITEITNQSFSKLTRSLLSKQAKIEKKKVEKVDKKKRTKLSGARVLLKMAEDAKKIAKKYGCDYPNDLSVNHDHYLYGAPKRKILSK